MLRALPQPRSPEQPPDQLEERGTTIVLLGSFNPAILQPAWFAARDLLAAADVDAKSLVLTDNFAAFSTDVVSVFCAQDRCQFAEVGATPTPDVIRDLMLGTFTILKETPVWECGINHAAHISPRVRRWDDVVAQLGDPQKSLILLDEQELRTIELRSPRTDGREGDRTVHLQPSGRLEGGAWFSLNDHIVVYPPDDRASIGAAEAMLALDETWDESRALADRVHALVAPQT